MRIDEIIKKRIGEALELSAIDAELIGLERPDDELNGDYSSNAALVFGKKRGVSPKELADSIVEEIQKEEFPEIRKIEVAGPGFINFFLSKNFLVDSVKKIIEQGSEYGKTTVGQGKKWAVEYGSPNPNKAMHLGHMRNTITGVAFCNILEANGATVIREMVDNDRGIAIAKLMWGYLVFGKKDGMRVEDISYWVSHKDEWHTPESYGKKADKFADDMYVKGSAECESEEIEKKVRQLVIDWENNNSEVWELWKAVLEFAHSGQAETLKRLGARFDYVWHEHEHYLEGKKYVEKGLKEGVFNKLEDGAIITDLQSEFGLSDTIVQKKDGTALYITQDIALTELKKKTHNPDRMVWVIGPEQSLAMQQLFAVCQQLGIGNKLEFTHIAYGYVSIKGQGKMSSRAGNVLYADDLLDEIKSKIQKIIENRIEKEKIDATAEIIAHGVVVYEMLKMGRLKDVAFDFEAALSFEGDSGPYLQYALTRANSVLAKAEQEGKKIDFDLPDASIVGLERDLHRLPAIVERAYKESAPQLLVHYLTALAGSFNSWYANNQIVSDDNEAGFRVALTKAFAIVMENGLKVLGIGTPSKM